MKHNNIVALLVAFSTHAALGASVYTLSPLAQVVQERCNNQSDDDQDGLTDCDDPDCTQQPKTDTSCRIEQCENNLDDDADGLIDCADPDCSSAPISPACLLALPIEVKLAPPLPEPEPEPDEEPKPEPAPPPPTKTEEPKVIRPAPASPRKAQPAPSNEPPPPVVFGLSLDGTSEGPGMAIPEGNTLEIDPSKSQKTNGPIKPLRGEPNSSGGGDPLPQPKPQPARQEVSAAEVTTKPKQLTCDDSTTKEYPQAAREAGVEGRISVELIIDEQGAVVEAKIIKGLGFGLDELALARAKSCTFSPATQSGAPVVFRLKGFPVLMQIQ
jgi:periplasmic protein TonB